MSYRFCSVEGCYERIWAKGLCSRHHGQAYRGSIKTPCLIEDCSKPGNGSLGLCPMHASRRRRATSPPCSVEECSKAAHCKGMCDMHYRRARKFGSTEPRPPVNTYEAAHGQVRRAKGRAREYPCVDCGDRALDWSYNYTAGEQEKVDPRTGSAYGPDPAHYSPRCRKCHRSFDDRVSTNPWRLSRRREHGFALCGHLHTARTPDGRCVECVIAQTVPDRANLWLDRPDFLQIVTGRSA